VVTIPRRLLELKLDFKAIVKTPAQSYREAHHLYEESMKENVNNTSVLLKLSDVYFLLGDLEKEQIYREKVYGTLRTH
jgi:hypothetical protein